MGAILRADSVTASTLDDQRYALAMRAPRSSSLAMAKAARRAARSRYGMQINHATRLLWGAAHPLHLTASMAKSTDHLSCQEVVELVTDYLDKALPPEEAALLEQHGTFCEGCVLYVEQINKTVEALDEVREEDISPEAKDRLMRAFRDWRGS